MSKFLLLSGFALGEVRVRDTGLLDFGEDAQQPLTSNPTPSRVPSATPQ